MHSVLMRFYFVGNLPPPTPPHTTCSGGEDSKFCFLPRTMKRSHPTHLVCWEATAPHLQRRDRVLKEPSPVTFLSVPVSCCSEVPLLGECNTVRAMHGWRANLQASATVACR